VSLTFVSSSKEDTIATILLTGAITSRLMDVPTFDEIGPFLLANGALALFLTLIYAVISEYTFRIIDGKNGYKSIGKYGYAWNHVNFDQ
jgi:hypothetical protein